MVKDIFKLLALLGIVIFISMCISISVGFIAQGFLMLSPIVASTITILTFCYTLFFIMAKVVTSKNKFINFFF